MSSRPETKSKRYKTSTLVDFSDDSTLGKLTVIKHGTGSAVGAKLGSNDGSIVGSELGWELGMPVGRILGVLLGA